MDSAQPTGGNIIPINIEDEMRGAYIDYSMSVIVSRALPDVRDGLKPVHRRILYAMDELGLGPGKPYKKSARIVGEVLGKYHPHGDTAVYDAMVRMAQTWSLRYPMVDGQGNFGSPDGDNPAAMRYTEARFKRIAEEMLADLGKNTVDFQPNFDDSLEEPSVMPSKIPNLLLNGSAGIAVGMATNMAPHNLTEVVNGIAAYIDNPEISILELMSYITAPDFPTGGIIYGINGIRQAYATGRGRVVIRAATTIEEAGNRMQIVATQLPYQVNGEQLVKHTSQLCEEKKLEGIHDIRYESDKEGTRIVFELKKDAVPQVVLNNLFAQTALQVSFSINNVALVKGRPHTLNLKELVKYFVEHRLEVIVRRTQYDLNEAEKRAHILEGLLKALDIIDEIITLIRASADAAVAKAGLVAQFGFSEVQAQAILDMRLQRLTGLEREKLQHEYDELMKTIAYLREILASEPLRFQIIKTELNELRDKYGDNRRTTIVYDAEEMVMEDMIANEDMVITISHQGYIKRTPLAEYRMQARGGVGSRGATTKVDDFTEHMFIANMHAYLLIFTDRGRLYWLKVYNLPEGSKTAKGRPIQNVIQIAGDEKVRTVLKVNNLDNEEYINNTYIMMCTEQGTIKKTTLEAFSRPRAAGIHAITINEGDRLLDVRLTSGNDDIVIAVRSGRAVRFNESRVRPMGRTAAGVTGIRFDEENDRVVGMIAIANPETQQILVISDKGFGKRSSVEEYRITNRGGQGVKTMNITDKTGSLVSILEVSDKDQLMIINKSGITIRLAVSELRVMGRATQGVKLIRLNEEDEIASIAKVEQMEDEPTGLEAEPGATGDAPENAAPADE
ncbi:MAG: DNA gyrase subunit A [Bernardetiaceae bacterium]|nr:DNA gyrase subunit A [Bernardetiaceae bacterium]